MSRLPPPLPGLTVLERGWLSSNNIVVHDDAGAVLVDTGHVNHAAQTVALVRQALAGQPLARIVNTHLHSDHCGGNAALQRDTGAPVWVPQGGFAAVAHWNDEALTYRATGQRMERFTAERALAPGDTVQAGTRRFEVIAAPGHDPDSLMLFDAADGVLMSADALWENGFGVVFPEMAGEPGFDDVRAVLDAIGRLPVRVVVPGHGAPFDDVAGALARARSRLAAFVADPRRHARHGAKVLIKYHLMEVREESDTALREWADRTPMLQAVWQRHGQTDSASATDWVAALAAELVAAGAIERRDAGYADA